MPGGQRLWGICVEPSFEEGEEGGEKKEETGAAHGRLSPSLNYFRHAPCVEVCPSGPAVRASVTRFVCQSGPGQSVRKSGPMFRAEARDRRPRPILPPPARRKQASRTPCRSILSFPAFSHAPSAHAPGRGPAGARAPGLYSIWGPARATGRSRPLMTVGPSWSCARSELG